MLAVGCRLCTEFDSGGNLRAGAKPSTYGAPTNNDFVIQVVLMMAMGGGGGGGAQAILTFVNCERCLGVTRWTTSTTFDFRIY